MLFFEEAMYGKSGTVKIYRDRWGFIDVDGDHQDLFFRRDDIRGDVIPAPGDRVSFFTKRFPRGLRAVKIQILDASEATMENWHEFIGIKPIQRKEEESG
jgi:cold shock CspA family protein